MELDFTDVQIQYIEDETYMKILEEMKVNIERKCSKPRTATEMVQAEEWLRLYGESMWRDYFKLMEELADKMVKQRRMIVYCKEKVESDDENNRTE